MQSLTVELHPKRLIDREAEPIFVLGSVRSGTSIMVSALRTVLGIPGFAEGNVAGMYQRMLERAAAMFQDFGPQGASSLQGLTDHFANTVTRIYQREMGSGRWLDKSPESYDRAPMMRFTPELKTSFPRAKFIYCVRRGIENIRSRQRKFPNVSFESFCQSWADDVMAWFEVSQKLGSSAILFHQHEMAIAPAATARKLAEFLGCDEATEARLAEHFANERTEQSQAANEHRWLGLDEIRWSDAEKQIYRERCSEAMAKLEYPMEGRVLGTASPIRLFVPIAAESVVLQNTSIGTGFVQPPNEPILLRATDDLGGPVSVQWKRIPLDGHNRFQVDVEFVGAPSEAGDITFELIDRQRPEQAQRQSLRCKVGAGQRLTVVFPPVRAARDVRIGFQPVGKARGLTLRLTYPHFAVDATAP